MRRRPMSRGSPPTEQESPRVFSPAGQAVPAKSLDPGLYVVATPIGNLGDITMRALATLAAADLIACEDTRVTGVLLRHYGISTRLVAYHEHNAERQRPKLLAALAEGRSMALVSDAGTPMISDPGFRLVNEALTVGHRVVPVPGSSAVLAALVASGLPSDAFLFAGFLPFKAAARRKRLEALNATPATLIFFESPRRLARCLADAAEVLGPDRKCVVARELTKLYEEVRRGTIGELATVYRSEAAPKGEIVVLIDPPPDDRPASEDVDALLVELLNAYSLREAASEAAERTGLGRRDLYQRALALKKGAGGDTS